MILHLVLTGHWWDETAHHGKRVEYRKITPYWRKRILDKADQITSVRFARGYTSTVNTYAVDKIDVGPCPIEGWPGDYIRIHFSELES